MRSNKRIIIIIATFTFFSLLINTVNLYSNSTRVEMSTNPENQIEKNPNFSTYWNLTGFPIYIDDDDPNYNWSKTAAENDWCTGNGTQENPYIIENVTIDGQGSGSCIEIKNSDVYFTINNCTLYRSGAVLDADAGIKLTYIYNGKLINNNCSFNGHGIFLLGGRYKNISGNTVNNNFGNGLNLDTTGYNTISGNTAYNNMDSGIYISGGGFPNKIMGNIVNNNEISGIGLNSPRHYTVSGNNVTNNNYGIYLEGASYQLIGANEISENNISYNNYGVYSLISNENNISSNNIDNSEIGIYLENSSLTNILENNISNNTIGIYLMQSNYNNIIGNSFDLNSLAIQELDCEGNYFKDNKGIPDSNGRFPFEIVIIIVISIIIIMITAGMVIFKRKSSRKEIISKSVLSPQELKELQKTEAEVSVEKEHHFCVVHRGKIVGAMYLCPKCETYYCMKCATVLKKKGEKCWACNNEIEL